MIAADAGEPALQIPTVHELVYHLRDDPPSRFACYGEAGETYALPPVNTRLQRYAQHCGQVSRKEAFSFGLARKLLAHYGPTNT